MKSSMSSCALIPELVPSPLFHKSVHDLFNNDKRWRRIRDATRAKVDSRCSACDTQNNPHCNEVWTYRDVGAIGVAELVGFEILCRDCHNAHHIGRIIALRDRAILDSVLHHLAKVNGISPKETVALVDAALKTHAKRSKKPWTMSVASDLLALYPDLNVANTGTTVVYRPKRWGSLRLQGKIQAVLRRAAGKNPQPGKTLSIFPHDANGTPKVLTR
jgi:hypothetical protein